MAQTAETRTSRKTRPCEGYRCGGTIAAGEEYARLVAFPGDDVNGGTGLWVLHICQPCATYSGQPMPPRRTEARTRTEQEETTCPD